MFCRKAKLSLPEIISNTALSYALGCKITSSFNLIGNFNGIWLSVMLIFSEPVYENRVISVWYIAKNTCCRDVKVPRHELALHTPCHVYSLRVLFKLNSKL